MSAQKKKAKPARGRQVDKWSLKSLHTIISPEDLEIGTIRGSPIGETFSDEPEKLINRILEVPLSDLTQKFSLVYIKLYFRITEVLGNSCKTKFDGHDYSSDFVRSLVKRRRTRIDAILTVTTNDNVTLRVTSTAFTVRRCKSSHKYEIRSIMTDMISKQSKESNFGEFVSKMLRGDLNNDLLQACQKVYPLTQVEVQKSKVLTKWT